MTDIKKKPSNKEIQDMRNTRKIYADKIEAKDKLEKSLNQCREAMALPQMQDVIAQLKGQIRTLEKSCRTWKGSDLKAHQGHLVDLDAQLNKINGVADEAALKVMLDSIKKFETDNQLFIHDMIGKPPATIKELAAKDAPEAPAGKVKPGPRTASKAPVQPKSEAEAKAQAQGTPPAQ